MQCQTLFLLAYNDQRWPWAPEEERRMSDAELPLLGLVLDGTAGKPECSDCFWRPCGLDQTRQQLHVYVWWPDHAMS